MALEVINFGCGLNAYESDVIRRVADGTDAVVVNSCAVTADTVREAADAVRKIRRDRPSARIVVTGCAAQTDADVFAAMPEVDHVLGNEEKLDPATWRGLATKDRVAVGDIMAVKQNAPPLVDRFGGRARAFVEVQNGCDHRCTFCNIPYGRGNSRSIAMDHVVAQVRSVVASGYHEVVLTGVDITSYGDGLGAAGCLGSLVSRVLKAVPDLQRLRLSTIDSVEADHDLLDAIASEPRLMPHLNLSLQAGDDLILKRMKRRHLRADAINFCEAIRRLRPDIAFGADLIVGFPTETDDMFARTLDLVDECGLTFVHAFPFSPRSGTPAARMPQVPSATVKERARRLSEKGATALRRHLDREVGQRRRLLIESRTLGTTEQFARVKLDAPLELGAIVELRMKSHDGRQLLAA